MRIEYASKSEKLIIHPPFYICLQQHNILLQIATKLFSENKNTNGKKAVEKSCLAEQGREVAGTPQKRKGPLAYKCRRFLQSITPGSTDLYWSDTEYVIFQVNSWLSAPEISHFSLLKETFNDIIIQHSPQNAEMKLT